MRAIGLLIVLAASGVHATDKYDHLVPPTGTAPVAIMGGDTPATYSVTCASSTANAGATLLVAAQNAGAGTGPGGATTTTRPLRNRCFQNDTLVPVAIGSSTVQASDYWVLGSSNSSTSEYCTHNSGAYYCTTTVGTTASTVTVIVETQSVP